jgi:hypothetical protein
VDENVDKPPSDPVRRGLGLAAYGQAGRPEGG